MNEKPKPLHRRITPVGWLALALAGLLVIGGLALTAKTVVARVRGLDGLRGYEYDGVPAEVSVHVPAAGADSAQTAPSRARPQGWSRETDFAGRPYLAPDGDDEAAIRAAFDAALACHLVVGQAPQDLAAHRQAVQAEAGRYLAGVEAQRACAAYDLAVLPAEHWGPANPVRCTDADTCSLGQAKTGPVSQAIVYRAELCQQAGMEAPCLGPVGQDEAPRRLYTATVERVEGTWQVTGLTWENLPDTGGGR